MLPGRAGDGSDLRAQRLRCRQRGRSVGPSLDGTLRQPARHERDRVAAHDRHAADATSPDQRCDANYSTLDVGCSFDVGCSSDVGPSPDDTEDLTRNDTEDLTRNVGCGADAIVDLHAAGFWHAGLRRVRGVGGSWLGAADPARCRAGRRLVDLEVAQEVGLGRRSRRAGDGDPHRHKHAAAIGPDRRDSGAAGPLVATTAFRPDRPHAPVGPPGRPRIRRPEKEPVRADPQLAPGVGRSGGRRERSAGNRA
jgi:hypothetical protein